MFHLFDNPRDPLEVEMNEFIAEGLEELGHFLRRRAEWEDYLRARGEEPTL